MGKQTAKVKYFDRECTHVPERDGPWATWHQARYAKGAAANEARRTEELIKKAARKQKQAESGKVRKPLTGRALEIANEHRDNKDLLIRETRAFLAANPRLPSEAHPILRLWVAKLPKAKNLKVGDDKEYVRRARSKLMGLREAYVAGDRNMLGFMRIDLDEVFGVAAPGGRPKLIEDGWEDLEARIEASPAPMPNIGVGATGLRDGIERPHVIFMLKDSVYCGPRSEVRFKSKYDGIVRRIVASMIPLGADPGGLSNGCKSKNPLSPAWSHRVMREEPWTLDELEKALPVPVSQRQLERKHAAYLASRAPQAGVAPDHADPVVASASNQAHRHVCKGAQAAVRQFRATGTFDEFLAHVLELAQEVCPDPESAVRKANYVAPWTWKNFRGRVPGQKLEPVALKATRAAATRSINYNRTKATMQAVMSACEALPGILGRKPLVAEIAAWAGVSEPSVRRYRPGGAGNPVGQQNDAICPQNAKPRHGVVKKGLSISGDGKEMGEATATPMESLPPEPSPIPAAPAPVEMVRPAPVRVFQEPVPGKPWSMPPPPSFMRPRHAPAIKETAPCSPASVASVAAAPPFDPGILVIPIHPSANQLNPGG